MWQAPKRPAAKVRRSECWIWNRGRTKAGYGQLMIKGRMNYAHRVAYQLFVGPIGRNLTIDHLLPKASMFQPESLGSGCHQGKLPPRRNKHRQERGEDALRQRTPVR